MYNLENTYPFNLLILLYGDTPETYDVCLSKVDEVIASLPERQYQMIKWHFIERKTYKECGAIWGDDASTAEHYYRKALRALRRPYYKDRIMAVSKQTFDEAIEAERIVVQPSVSHNQSDDLPWRDRYNLLKLEYDKVKECIHDLILQLSYRGIDTNYMTKELQITPNGDLEIFINIDIDSLHLQPRSRQLLQRAGITTIRELANTPRTQLRKHRGVGDQVMEDIESHLLTYFNIILKD